MTSMEKQTLIDAIERARHELATAEKALCEYESLAENNVFSSIEEALEEIEDKLTKVAESACAGAYNRGKSQYKQLFIVDGITYIALMKVEYNRHDKTYYYIDEVTMSYKQA